MKIIEKQRAIELRKKGYSLNEIRNELKVSKGTLSLWLKNIVLSQAAEQRIEEKMTNGQIASRKVKFVETALKEINATIVAQKIIKRAVKNSFTNKIICAMIYYCEGIKNVREGIVFTNSDPDLIALFLGLFRRSFILDEKKFRVCVHLHSYHDKDQQLKFWSKTSTIPLGQFIKPYQKKHSGLYKKEGYQGCVSIRYGDVKIAREMKAIALQFMKMGL